MAVAFSLGINTVKPDTVTATLQLYYSKFYSKVFIWLHLLCSENFLLCFLELLQFCAYYARFYATPQSIMLLIIQSLIYISMKLTYL